MDRVTVRVPRVQVIALWLLVRSGQYPNRSEAVRSLLRNGTIPEDVMEEARQINREVVAIHRDQGLGPSHAKDKKPTDDVLEEAADRAGVSTSPWGRE